LTFYAKIALIEHIRKTEFRKPFMKFVSLSRKFLKFASLSLAITGFVWQVQGAVINLQNGNSFAQINPGTSAGMFHWDIQGQNQLQQQWFWYRVGNTAEAPINNIGPATVTTFLGTRGADISYNNGSYSLIVEYLMNPGGTIVGAGQIGQADISESITIQNLSANPLSFHLFQYSDFDLAGSGSDSISLGTDSFGNYNSASQSDGVSTLTESVSVVAPSASHGEAGVYNTTLTRLTDAVPTTLNDINAAGPGNVTWAFEWDLTIGAGNSVTISKDKHLQVQIVPEPSALALVGLGLVAARAVRRKRD
jgi:hypothetical protein